MKGLVLEGGGTKGAFQIGAYKALRSLGIDFQGVSGTSIGALNGAYILQNDIEVMEEIWTAYDYTHFLNIDEISYEKYKNVDFTPKNFNSVLDLMNKARKNQGLDISPLRALINKTLNEDYIRNSKKDFGLVTVSWQNNKIIPEPMYIEQIPKGRLTEYLIASANLPIFKIDPIDDKVYLDGMFSDNIPVKMLVDKGYNDIVVIRLLDDFIGQMNLSRYKDIDIKTIVPSEYLGGSLNKDTDHIKRNINMGYMDTMKAYNRYEGIKYYFNVDYKYDEDYCFNKLKNVDKKTIEYILKFMGIKKDPTLRTLMEDIIPRCGELLGLPKNFTYKDLFYSIYERKLEENNISRIALYDFNKLIDTVNKNIDKNNEQIVDLEINPIIAVQKNKSIKLITSALVQDFKK